MITSRSSSAHRARPRAAYRYRGFVLAQRGARRVRFHSGGPAFLRQDNETRPHLPRTGQAPKIPTPRRGNFSAAALQAQVTGKIPAWFVPVVSSRHPIERLCHEIPNPIRILYLAYHDERAETIYGGWPLLFNSVASLDMLLLPFSKQVGPRGHTNSHGHPHFFMASIWLVNSEIPG